MALDATFGGAESNSFVADLAEARAIATGLAPVAAALGVDFTGFNAASDPQLELILLLAAQALCAPNYKGTVQSTEQALPFPRRIPGRVDLSSPTALPLAIKQAQVIEGACLASPANSAQQAALYGVTSQSVGSKTTTFSKTATSTLYAAPTASFLARVGLTGNTGGSGSVYVNRS